MAIRQHRPDVLAALAGRPVDQALALIPVLLPICGVAQSVAANRAVEAARGLQPSMESESGREQQIWHEQALSIGWRMSVDWPELLGQSRQMAWLKTLRNCNSNQDCADALRGALPGLDSITGSADLATWAAQSNSAAAAMVQLALKDTASDPARTAGNCIDGVALVSAARSALDQNPFDHLAPVAEPLEVGPLAMARDPLIAELREQYGTAATARLLALVLDTRRIIRGLEDEAGADATAIDAWHEGENCGSARALTARGPVFHRVELDNTARVARWRALAPTDWHFAPNGPAATALERCTSGSAARLIVASFDPCAPWTLRLDGED